MMNDKNCSEAVSCTFSESLERAFSFWGPCWGYSLLVYYVIYKIVWSLFCSKFNMDAINIFIGPSICYVLYLMAISRVIRKHMNNNEKVVVVKFDAYLSQLAFIGIILGGATDYEFAGVVLSMEIGLVVGENLLFKGGKATMMELVHRLRTLGDAMSKRMQDFMPSIVLFIISFVVYILAGIESKTSIWCSIGLNIGITIFLAIVITLIALWMDRRSVKKHTE